MAETAVEQVQTIRIQWRRCKISREDLGRLNKRSDLKGAMQTLGFLALLGSNGALAFYSFHRWPWYVTALLTFLHGTWCHFSINAFHELVHDSVFKTRWLNGLFLRVFSFLGWQSHHWFWASHTEHHKYTLHDPYDSEVVLPIRMSLGGFLQSALVDVTWFWRNFSVQARRALGNYNPRQDKWTATLFGSDPAGRRKLVRWSRILLLGHGLIIGVSLYMHWWMLPVLVSFTPAYGRWLQFLCNESQHVGLQSKVPDFRLCCRTIYLNPLLRFVYWHMNYHIEHHSFAAVPCYNLGKLHRLIKDQLPPCPKGLLATWRQIAEIFRRQKVDPSYQYVAPLPGTSAGGGQ